MSKEIYISSTPHETRLAIVENDALAEIYYERENEYTLAGSIYNGRVTRVLPGMQSSFVDIGLERDAFLYITDFMEEAGDSADFEANANSGDHDRQPRREGGGGQRDQPRGRGDSRGERGGRNDREGSREAQAAPAELTDADLFSQAVASLDPARVNSESERSGGRRRRGRSRGEGRSQALSSGPDRLSGPEPLQGEPRTQDESVGGDQPVNATPVEDLGEGAPGADGSRRWRGRRGRRGNPAGDRTNGQADGGSASLPAGSDDLEREPQSAIIPAERASTGPVSNAYGQDSYGKDAWDEPDFQQESVGLDENVVDLHAAAPDRRNEQRGDRSRGERDRSGRDRGGRGPREDRGSVRSGDSEPAGRYGEPEFAAAPLEPIILPGESLGKYRKDSGAEGKAGMPVAASIPASTEFVLPAAWDGGAVLPGETIRPRNSSANAPQESRDRGPGRRDRDDRNDRGDLSRGDRGRDNRGRNERGQSGNERPRNPEGRAPSDHGGSSQSAGVSDAGAIERTGTASPVQPQYPAESVSPFASERTRDVEDSAPTYLSDPQQVPASHLVTPLDTTFVAPPPMPERDSPSDYEPTEASASYRVDPLPPSEFRQPAPVLEVEPQAHSDHEAEAQPEAAHNAPPAWGEDHAHDAPQSEDREADEQHVAEHQVTAIDASGAMHSEPSAELVAEREAALAQGPSATVESSFAEESEISGHGVVAAQPAIHFAPGSGVLEEEVMEDEEDGATIADVSAAHHSAPFDADDHETLEGAADLATMIRELSIDQITRHQADSIDEDLDDDEEFDEDFEEEDRNYDPNDGSDNESEEDGEQVEDEGEEGSDESSVEEAETGSSNAFPRTERAAGEQGESRQNGSLREPRREGRRDGRRGDRNRRSAGGERGGTNRSRDGVGDGERSANPGGERSANGERGSNGERHQDRGGDRNRQQHGRGRQTMQSTNLPAISDLLKPGQELLCQIAKEPIAKKGARITSHIALPGRFLVFMPTVSHTGVSRKIESDGERRRLKEILLSEKGEAAGGFIVRTAAAGASEEELRSDLRFLLNLWNDIKARSESSKSPALIYHDLNLVERVLRDQVTDTFSAIWVDTETEYERVLRFLQRFQPSLIRRVKLYTKETPLFEQFGITEEINKALRSKVWLKSGGSIVINQTEALVAIDINTGKFVGKTARLEDTIVKTNLDAIPEIVRQIRLRDLGGIIIIDFIDMDERKNRNKVMAALEEELKLDRAPSKVLQFNDFGLVAITRKRVKQSLERTLSTTCGVCAGTGMVKSPVTVCNDIYVEMRKMQKHLDRGDVMLRVHPEVVKQLKSGSARWLQEMEEMVGKTILVKSDPALHPEQFDIH